MEKCNQNTISKINNRKDIFKLKDKQIEIKEEFAVFHSTKQISGKPGDLTTEY